LFCTTAGGIKDVQLKQWISKNIGLFLSKIFVQIFTYPPFKLNAFDTTGPKS
jgi:hypothetical protein